MFQYYIFKYPINNYFNLYHSFYILLIILLNELH